MNNSIKVSICESTLIKMIRKAAECNAFDFNCDFSQISYSEMTGGFFNTIYIINFGDIEAILKVSPLKSSKVLRYEKNIMRTEVEVLNIVKNKINIPVPKIYFYDDIGEIENLEYFIMQKINGENLKSVSKQLSDEENNAIVFELGKINSKINEISNSKFGYFSQLTKQSSSWGEAFYNLVSDILEDGKDANVLLPYDEIEDIFEKHLYVCDSVKTPKLVHRDLWPGNVLINNKNISGIIDFERALWADPLMEYYFSNILKNKYFCDGYGINLNDLDEESKIRRTLYNIYLYLVLKIECYYRNYTSSSQNTWAEKRLYDELKKLK